MANESGNGCMQPAIISIKAISSSMVAGYQRLSWRQPGDAAHAALRRRQSAKISSAEAKRSKAKMTMK